MLKKLHILIVSFVILAFSGPNKNAQVKEYDVKAAFIYKFTKYIQWHKQTTNKNTFMIGVVGTSSITDPMEKLAKSKSVEGREIQVMSYSKNVKCDVVFFSKNVSRNRLVKESLSENCKYSLLISEKEGLAKHGSAINFLIVNNKLKFEINYKEIQNKKLKVSSQLLKLATKVYK